MTFDLHNRAKRMFFPPKRKGADRERLGFVALGVVAMALLIGGRMVQIATSEGSGPAFRTPVDMQIAASRPRILDRNGDVMALDVQMKSVFAEPNLIEKPQETFDKLATVLPDLDYDETMKH
ncbi:MAG: hypothetical protein AAFO70_08695, partial [Pseudomonadota bacterium]